ncbi:MAG: crossover junction endodeoxyribonuclease RuvC, partial [Gammaproteobacteria bacterium]|nr:crossover junction endodeoxyribonuclease RuvC [Gammaproteobacteria bacterium]
MPIILGIDPGSRRTGYGVINHQGQRYEYIDSGCIRTQGDSFPDKLAQIFEGLSEIITLYLPQEVA